jgi:antitoxin component of MazEF toxin-antitoxin module
MKIPLTKIGGSRAVILPSVWFKQHENETGTMNEVEMEISEKITISKIVEGGTDDNRNTETAPTASQAD